VGICGIDCRGLLGASWLGDSTLNGTRLVEPRSIDLSDCACWVPFSLRCQVVLGTSHERYRVCANRSDNGRSAPIEISIARARAIVVAKVRREIPRTSAGETPAREPVRSNAVPIPNHAPATTPRANRGDSFNTKRLIVSLESAVENALILQHPSCSSGLPSRSQLCL
jgi:hypothetical protein